ncbi:MAG: methyltransferase, partial [Bacteroidota bacterium]
MKKWSFFREAVKTFRTTGSIAASSPALVKKLVEPLPANRPIVIVELGPGDGCVTRAILDKIHPKSTLTAFEINEVFIEKLDQIEDARFKVLGIGAERLTDFFPAESVDYVVSS